MNTLLLKAASALLLSAAALRPLVGQEPAIPDSGARVRVWIPTGRIAGRLVQLSADSVILKPGSTSAVRRWPRETVYRLEVSRGRRGHFWIGLASGTVVGFAAGKAAADATDDKLGAGAVGVMVWLGGTVAGGIVGALIRTEGWAPAAWPPADERFDVVARSRVPLK